MKEDEGVQDPDTLSPFNWLGWLFPRFRGFWENVPPFIPHLRLFGFLFVCLFVCLFVFCFLVVVVVAFCFFVFLSFCCFGFGVFVRLFDWFVLFFEVRISSRTLMPHLMSGSVHSGSAS